MLTRDRPKPPTHPALSVQNMAVEGLLALKMVLRLRLEGLIVLVVRGNLILESWNCGKRRT